MKKNVLITLLSVFTMVILSGCGKSEKEESQIREAEYLIEQKNIEDEKWSKVKDTVMDGHPMDAYDGYTKDNKKIDEYQQKIEQERQIQNQ